MKLIKFFYYKPSLSVVVQRCIFLKISRVLLFFVHCSSSYCYRSYNPDFSYLTKRCQHRTMGWVNHLFKQIYFCCNLKEVKISTLILSSCKLLLGWISIHEINYVQSTLQRTWPRTRHGSWRGLRWLHCHTSSTSCFLLILGAERASVVQGVGSLSGERAYRTENFVCATPATQRAASSAFSPFHPTPPGVPFVPPPLIASHPLLLQALNPLPSPNPSTPLPSPSLPSPSPTIPSTQTRLFLLLLSQSILISQCQLVPPRKRCVDRCFNRLSCFFNPGLPRHSKSWGSEERAS